jgi:hypothetical protein
LLSIASTQTGLGMSKRSAIKAARNAGQLLLLYVPIHAAHPQPSLQGAYEPIATPTFGAELAVWSSPFQKTLFRANSSPRSKTPWNVNALYARYI